MSKQSTMQTPGQLFNVELPPRSTTLTLPDPPSANRWWRMVVIRGQPRMLVSKEAREYKKRVGQLGGARAITDGPVRLSIDWDRDLLCETVAAKTRGAAIAKARAILESGRAFCGSVLVNEQVVDWMCEEDHVGTWENVGESEEVA